MRIGQSPYIKHKVRIGGNTVFKAEGLEENGQKTPGHLVKAVAHQLPQLIDIGVAGVDDQIGPGGDHIQQLPLPADGLHQGDTFLLAQRMAAAGFAIALDQDFVVGVEKQHLHHQTAVAQFFQQLGKMLEIVTEVAGIHPDGAVLHRIAPMGEQGLGERLEQLQGQVVHTVVVQILQGLQGDALTGAGQTADDNHPHDGGPVISLCWRWMRSSSAL